MYVFMYKIHGRQQYYVYLCNNKFELRAEKFENNKLIH